MASKKKKTGVSVDSPPVSTDEVYDYLFESINGMYKDKQLAFNLNEENAPTDVVDFVDTGCTELNLALSNDVNGGLPVGKIVEFVGWEGSGKSLLAAHAIANTQKAGGIGLLLDTESAFNRGFANAIGLDVNKLIYTQPDSLEECYEIIEQVLTKLREYGKNDKIVTIVLDSAAGVPTKTEIEGDYDKEGWATQKAIVNSKAMRKITSIIAKQKALLIITNQLRDKLGVTFGDKSTTSGGKAIGFHSTIRLRLKPIGKIKDSDGVIHGIQTHVEVFKNRIAPPWRQARFSILYDRGIDNVASLFDAAVKLDIIKSGAWCKLYDPDDKKTELMKFRRNDFEQVLEDHPGLEESIIREMQTNLAFHYQNDPSDEDLLELAKSNEEPVEDAGTDE